MYHKRHLFSLMSIRQKFIYFLSFLYPYPTDVEVLPLPKYLHFLYFPLRPFLWAMEKNEESVLVIRRKVIMRNILYFTKRIHTFAGKILYFNLIGMMLISLFEGIGIFF